MKFKLIIDKTKDEEVVATVKKKTAVIEEIRQLVETQGNGETLTAYLEDEIVMLKITEIESIFVQEGKTYVAYSNGKRYRLKQRLYETEAMLPDCFVRINKSAVGNWNKIKRFKTEFSGAVDVEFKSGYVDYVSRRCFAVLKRRYDL